jgi:hypothetical protein
MSRRVAGRTAGVNGRRPPTILRIGEIADLPNGIVSVYFQRVAFA